MIAKSRDPCHICWSRRPVGETGSSCTLLTPGTFHRLLGAISTYVVVLVIYLMLAIKTFTKEGKFPALGRYNYVRLHWENINTIASEVLEFLQMSALVLAIDGLPIPWASTLKDGRSRMVCGDTLGCYCVSANPQRGARLQYLTSFPMVWS